MYTYMLTINYVIQHPIKGSIWQPAALSVGGMKAEWDRKAAVPIILMYTLSIAVDPPFNLNVYCIMSVINI